MDYCSFSLGSCQIPYLVGVVRANLLGEVASSPPTAGKRDLQLNINHLEFFRIQLQLHLLTSIQHCSLSGTMSLENITTVSPSTNRAVVTRPSASPVDLQQIPEAAQEAFRSFSQSTTLEQRQQIVTRALDVLEKKKDVLSRELAEQMGRPIHFAPVEITTAIKRAQYLTRIAPEVLGEQGTVPGEQEKGFNRYIKRKPIGVALIIFAWNVSSRPTLLGGDL